jgi:hypothetical protein
VGRFEVVVGVLEVDVVDNGECGDFCIEWNVSVGGEEKVYAVAYEGTFDTELEEEIPKDWVTGLRTEDERMDVWGKKEGWVVFSVEEEVEVVFGVGTDNALEGFVCEPADAVHFP